MAQIQRCSMKPSKVSKIFITHAHGDHSFGLPGLLCIMGQNSERGRIVEVYGPTVGSLRPPVLLLVDCSASHGNKKAPWTN